MVASINIPKETAQTIDKDKRAIEARTQAALKRVFNDMADDAEALYRARGNIDARELAENYRTDFLTNIRTAYRQTIKKFGFELRDSINQKHAIDFDIEYKKQLIDLDYKQTVEIEDSALEQNIENVNTQFQEEAALFIANQSEEQSDLVTNTNASEIEKAIAFGVAAYATLLGGKTDEQQELNERLLAALDKPKEKRRVQRRLDRVTREIERISREQQAIIAKEIKDKIKKDGISRSELIASQEVGIAEAWSREKEAEIIDNTALVTPAGIPIKTFKEWVAILDRRTREAHVRADGQRVPVNEPFQVGGELLQFPRDPRGSAGNVINCRCVAVYNVSNTETRSSNLKLQHKAVSDIDLTPTESMAKTAKRALQWRKEFGRGGTAVGVARARDISNKKELSPSTIGRMVSFFARHEVDKRAEGFNSGEEGFPSNGRIAWDLWGGDPGKSWANKKWEQIKRERSN